MNWRHLPAAAPDRLPGLTWVNRWHTGLADRIEQVELASVVR